MLPLPVFKLKFATRDENFSGKGKPGDEGENVERKASRRRVLPIDVDWVSTTHQVQLTNHSDSNRQSAD